MKILVLGAGRVGSAIVADLLADPAFEVSAADASEASLGRLDDRAARIRLDVADPAALDELLPGFDIIVGAVPGHLGFRTLERVLHAGKPVVDISFFDEDAFALDDLARARGVTAVVDCGVAPGCGNLILGRLEAELDAVDRFECLVGGLPVVRTLPFEYKAPFSPIDVIEEYTRPARIRRDGVAITLPALSEPELVEIPDVGTLEAFNTDGLRSLLRTSHATTLIEKTMRYPGHAERMRMLRDAGFFDETPIEVGDAMVSPRELTSRLLIDAWHLAEGEEDLTAMRVVVEGGKGGRRLRYTFTMLDRYDRVAGVTSMARTTGYTCTAAVRILAHGGYARPGINPPEYLGAEPEAYRSIFEDLRARGVDFVETVTQL